MTLNSLKLIIFLLYQQIFPFPVEPFNGKQSHIILPLRITEQDRLELTIQGIS